MGRKIVLLSDGTGNSAAKVWRTNVWRTFEGLDLSGSDQVAFYDDGVGTSSFKPLAVLGGAFGFGLKRNVIDIYKFACRNWRDESDEIFGFGFSRGAFTIRVVMGLILNQGLIAADTEEELDRKAQRSLSRVSPRTLSYVSGASRHLFRGFARSGSGATITTRRTIASDPAHPLHRRVGYCRRLRPADRRDDARRQPLDLAAGVARPQARSDARDARLPGAVDRRGANHFPSRIVG